jgi:hypothetical protein
MHVDAHKSMLLGILKLDFVTWIELESLARALL